MSYNEHGCNCKFTSPQYRNKANKNFLTLNEENQIVLPYYAVALLVVT